MDPIRISHWGLHSGTYATIEVLPAPKGSGVLFCWGTKKCLAHIDFAREKIHSTAIYFEDKKIHLTEHLLSAIHIAGISDAYINVITGDEIPLGDGCADIFCAMIAGASKKSSYQGKSLYVTKPFTYHDPHDSNRFISVKPHHNLSIEYTLLGDQSLYQKVSLSNLYNSWDRFVNTIAPARTFILEENIQKFWDNGLAKGANTENVLIIKDGKSLYLPFRVHKELAKHKVLDLIGDLRLCGGLFAAKITAQGTGHKQNLQFLKQLLQQPCYYVWK